MKSSMRLDYLRVALTLMVAGTSLHAYAQPNEPIFSLAKKEKPALLESLKALVSIETGSRDFEGLGKLADLIAGRLKDLGGKVELVAPSDVYKMEDTPEQIGKMVRATFTGNGTKKILLIAHMDTVYPRGMLAKQPFRIEGDRAYGLGIADDKQGIARDPAHTGDAQSDELPRIRHPHRAHQRRRGDQLAGLAQRAFQARRRARRSVLRRGLARRSRTSYRSPPAGIAAVMLNVKGRASHAGSAPENGRNALYELAHQILQTRDFSDPATGLKMNWTVASAGTNRNVIPPGLRRVADVRVLRVADYDGIEKKVRERDQETAYPRDQGRDDFRAPPPAARGHRRRRARSPSMRRRSTPSSARRSWSATSPRAAAPMRLSRRSRPRRRCSSASACRASARIRTTPNTCCSIRSSRASICSRA